MKKIVLLAIAFMFVIFMVGCWNENYNYEDTSKAYSTTQDDATTDINATTEVQDITGLTIIDDTNDSSWGELHPIN